MEWPVRQELIKFPRPLHKQLKQLRYYQPVHPKSESLNIIAWAHHHPKILAASWIKTNGVKIRVRSGKSTPLVLMTSRNLRIMVIWAKALSFRLSLTQWASRRKGLLHRMLRDKLRGTKGQGWAANIMHKYRKINLIARYWTQQVQSPATTRLR